MKLELKSRVFSDGKPIPSPFSAEGRGISPPLEWSGVPRGTREFVLIVDDPDAPGDEPFVHWLLYNISGNITALPEGLPTKPRIEAPVQADQGENSGGSIGYMGPLPPRGHGVHHYRFHLYALDAELGIRPGLKAENKSELIRALKNHILAEASLVGTYVREAKKSA